MAHITFVLGFCNKYNLNKLKVCDLWAAEVISVMFV